MQMLVDLPKTQRLERGLLKLEREREEEREELVCWKKSVKEF